MDLPTRVLAAHLLFVLVLGGHVALAQTKPDGQNANANDPLLAKVRVLELENQTVFDGIAKLSAVAETGFAVERELTSKQKPQLAPVIRFTARIENVSIRQALDWLFQLDPRYTWKAEERFVNVFPRYVERDPEYPLNRTIRFFEVRNANSAGGAAMAAADHAEPPQQLAVLQLGDTHFSKPVSFTFEGVTLRQALNQIARQLGPTYGWQFSGTIEFRFMAFHDRLLADPPPSSELQRLR